MKALRTPLFVLLAATLVAGVLIASPGNVDKLRFGTAVNAEGRVPAESHTDRFVPGAPIHVTMDVSDVPEGSDLMLSILDRETDELVWSDEQDLPGGRSVVHFVVSDMRVGKFRAKVKVGDDWVAEHEFRVEQ